MLLLSTLLQTQAWTQRALCPIEIDLFTILGFLTIGFNHLSARLSPVGFAKQMENDVMPLSCW